MASADSDISHLEDAIQPVIGEKVVSAWVDKFEFKVHNILIIDLGNLKKDDEDGLLYGIWQFVVKSSFWRLEQNGKVICGYFDTKGKMDEGLKTISGKRIVAVSISTGTRITRLVFEDDLEIRLIPSLSKRYIHWSLYTPDKNVVNIGPGQTWSMNPDI